MGKFKILTAEIIKSIFEEKSLLAGKLNGEVTDYANLLGVCTYGSSLVDDTYGDYWIKGYNSYTSSLAHLNNVFYQTLSNSIGTRPVIGFSEIKDRAIKIDDYPIEKYQFGEYPQSIVKKEIQQKLESLYWNNNIQKTDRFYTIVPRRCKDSIDLYSLAEYEVDGKRYVRVPYMEDGKIGGISLDMIKYLPSYWVEVEPITWLVDKKLDIAISEKVLFSGVPFNDRKVHNSEYYKNVTPILEQYLDRVFSYEINESSLISPQDKELDSLIGFTIDKVYGLLGGRKTQDGLIDAVDDIVIALVNLANKKNIIKPVSSEKVVNKILADTYNESRGKQVGFVDFNRAISKCQMVTEEAREEAVDRIYSKKPVREGCLHHDDWWENSDTYYPTCNHLIKRPVEKVYWKRMN